MSNLALAVAIENAPDLMKELTLNFIAQTDLADRAKIRLRMKAILDFISVDTTYPKVPGLDGKSAAAPTPTPQQGIGHTSRVVDLQPQQGGTVTGTPLFPAPGLVRP